MSRYWIVAVAAVLLVAPLGCGGDGGGGGATGTAGTQLMSQAYEESGDDFLNPERGFYGWVDLVNGRDFTGVTAAGQSLAYAGVSLASWRFSALPSSLFTNLNLGFAAVRQAGIKVILRFTYSNGIGDPDAPKAQILAHIGQLQPLLAANADVIAVMQGGFIGAWGEWHSSTNGLDNPTDRADILTATLAALPPSRMVQIRTPQFKQQILGGSPLGPGEAFNGSARARTGHHNDAYLASFDDMGTYMPPVEANRNWVAADTQFVVMGGETAAPNLPRSGGANALAESAMLHVSFLNNAYHPTVLQSWWDQGAMPEMRRRLGYRISLVQAGWGDGARPGGTFALTVRVRNSGFASFYNARPVYVVLASGSEAYGAPVSVDPRTWWGGAEHEFTVSVRLPASFPMGTCELGLWMPDASDSIRGNPAYAVRFANDGVWRSDTGFNVLTEGFQVAGGLPDTGSASAPTLEPLP